MAMKLQISFGVRPRLVVLCIAIALLGVAPRPHAFRQSLERTLRAVQAGDVLPASQSAEQAARLMPWRGDLWEQAGLYALKAGEPAMAVEHLQQAWRTDRSFGLSMDGWVALGDAFLELGDTPEAIRAWTAGLGRFGSSNQLLDRLWQAQLSLGNFETAAANLESMLAKNPHDPLLHYRMGLLLTAQRPEDALDYLDEAAQLDPRYQFAAGSVRRALLSARSAEDPVYTLVSAGRALAVLGEWDLATENFRQATLARPDYAEAWAYLGEARQHAGEGSIHMPRTSTSDGLTELQVALRLDQHSLAAHTFLALYWTRKANFAQAVHTIRDAVALDPKNPALQVQYAGILAASGDLEGAHQSYLRAIDLSPYDPAFRRYLVEFALEYDYEIESLALPLARRLVALYPNSPESLDLMGRVLIKLEDLDSAERFLKRSLEKDPQYAPAHMHLGLIYALRGDRSQALKSLDLAISLASGTPTAAQAQRLVEIYFP